MLYDVNKELPFKFKKNQFQPQPPKLAIYAKTTEKKPIVASVFCYSKTIVKNPCSNMICVIIPRNSSLLATAILFFDH